MAPAPKREVAETNATLSNSKKLKPSPGSRDAPIVYLNVGGENVNLPRSLLAKFDDSSPLCCMLKAIWSPSNPVDEENRIYLNRDPAAFRDLLSYLRYGSAFLQEIAASKLRTHQLQVEADYFLVPDVHLELVKLGLSEEPVSFQSDQWVSFAAVGDENRWNWDYHSGNQKYLKKVTSKEARVPWGMEVGETGTYLLFFRLAAIATEPVGPSCGYPNKSDDEFVKVSRFTGSQKGSSQDAERYEHWTHTMLRCGMFDPRDEDERTPKDGEDAKFIQYTASAAEIVSLRKGDILYMEHATRCDRKRDFRPTSMLLERHAEVDPSFLNRLTLVKVHGNTLVRYDRVHSKETLKIATWKKSRTDFPPTTFDPKLIENGTNIETTSDHGANHLVLGRVASTFAQPKDLHDDRPAPQSMRLQVETQGGRKLHASSCVCYGVNHRKWKHCSESVDYGSLNDLVFLEDKSRLSVGNNDAHDSILASHGTIPVPYPTQNLCLLKLSPHLRVDRYRLEASNDSQVSFIRSIEDPESTPLFCASEIGLLDDSELVASSEVFDDTPTSCIVIGSVPPTEGSCRCSLFVNNEQWAMSKIPNKDHEGGFSRHKHFFHEVLELKKGDRISILNQWLQGSHDFGEFYGHLAFILMDRPCQGEA